MSVFIVSLDNVPGVWPIAERLFAPLLAKVETHTIEDVFNMIMGRTAHLWLQTDSNGLIEAACVSDFEVNPRGVWLRIWLGATMPDCKLDDGAWIAASEGWRDRNRCKGVVIIGRHGWLRRYPDLRVEGLVMRGRVK
jgi:hypothetical protein